MGHERVPWRSGKLSHPGQQAVGVRMRRERGELTDFGANRHFGAVNPDRLCTGSESCATSTGSLKA